MIDIDISADTTVGDLSIEDPAYSANRLSSILDDISKHIPRVVGEWETDMPTQQQLTQYVKNIWAALSGEANG